MGKRRCLRTVIGKTHIFEFYFAVLGHLWTLRCNQPRRAHHLIDAAQRRAGQHHAGRGKHNLGQRRGDDRGKYRIKRKVGYKACQAASGQRHGCKKQRHWNHEYKRAFSERQVDRLRHAADLALKASGFFAVFFYRLLKRLERIDGLLEDLDHRDAAHIFGARLAYAILRRLILGHEPGVLAAHHGEHREYGNHRCHKTRGSHPPVKHEHQYDHAQKQGDRPHDVRQIVREQRFRLSCRRIQSIADQTRGVRIKEAQWSPQHMGNAPLADVGCRAKRRQMGTHQPRKIQQYAAHRKARCHPAITRNALRLHPVRRYGNQITRHQPYADVGCHAHEHGYRR